MYNKKGRPRKDNPKVERISARVDDTLLQDLKDYCDTMGVSVADVIRVGVTMLIYDK